MTNFRIALLIILLVPGMSLRAEEDKTIDPPKQLQWGMGYSEVVQVLHDQGIETENLNEKIVPHKGYKEYPELHLSDSSYRAELKKVELFDRKAKRSYAIFDHDTTLQSFHYIMHWDRGSDNKGGRQCWVFHSKLKAALIGKYGEPNHDEASELVRGTVMPSGVKYTTFWSAADSSSIQLIITRQVHNMIIGKVDGMLIFLLYRAPGAASTEIPSEVIEEDI